MAAHLATPALPEGRGELIVADCNVVFQLVEGQLTTNCFLPHRHGFQLSQGKPSEREEEEKLCDREDVTIRLVAEPPGWQ